MGRDPGRPPGYRNLLEFDFRQQVEGGDVRVPGQASYAPDAWARRHCLVLVHGFNDTDGEAAEEYFLGFRTRQNALWNPVDPDAFNKLFGDAFWPGDADWFWIFDKLDFLIYPHAIGSAVTTAQELAALVLSMPNLMQVDFVAHSLGCRVALEAIKVLHAQGGPAIGRVCLMAAAVPAEMLEPGGIFHGVCLQLAADGTRVHVLHSLRDRTLHYAFPPGQALAGAAEASDRALGRYGPTPDMPGMGATLTEMEISAADHGDYWGKQDNEASRQSSEASGTFLRLGDAPRAVSAPRSLVASATDIDSRTLGASRALGSARSLA